MNNKNQYFSEQINRRRRLRYGALAVGITAAVVALVIALNAVFSALAQKFMWFADMTGEDLYSISQQTRDLIDGCKKERDITFYFCDSPDHLDSKDSTHLVHNLIKLYAEEYEFISVEYLDIVNHPDSIPAGVAGASVTDVIVSDGITPKKLAVETFFIKDPDDNTVWAFNGEYKVNISLLQYEDSPIAYFTSGHGENIENSEMWTLFADAGYDVRTIDLEKETPEDAALVMVINCPQKDFLGASDSVNEIRKIDQFLDKNGGLMVFLDAGCPSLPELDEYLTEWGIKFENRLIRDYENSMTGTDGKTLFAEYLSEGTGSSLTDSVTSLASLPRTVINNARPITLLWETNTYGNSTRIASPVLRSSDTARSESLDGNGDSTTGAFDLMTVSVDSRYVNNEPNYSYVLAAGTSSFADDEYLKNTYGNRDVIFYIMRTFGKKAAPFDSYEWIKPFDNDTLNITSGQANRLTVLLVAIIPVAVFAVGFAVYKRRKNL